MDSSLPDSAISSWGGFVYQGKVALYHSVQLLIDSAFQGSELPEFQLQLDSTDDFAIYSNGLAISIHQVKAKISPYRTTFTKALGKSSLVETDCTSTTKRYFHIASKIDDDSDYVNSSQAVVEFYKYGTNSYCKLDEIESVTKKKIAEYLEKHGLSSSQKLVDRKYCYLSEFISARVVKIHSLIHAGDTQNHAAYTETIQSHELVNLIRADYKSEVDVPYILKELRMMFASTFEGYVVTNSYFNSNQVDALGKVFRFVYQMDDATLLSVMHSLRPSERGDNIREDDLQNYMDVISEISRAIVLAGLPHYSNKSKRYLPTSLKLSNRKIAYFRDGLLDQIRANPRLANVLYEYNTLITGTEDHEIVNVRGQSDKITNVAGTDNFANNIVQEFPVSIISMKTAQGELDA